MNTIIRFLKAFITWANSRTWAQTAWWVAWAAVTVNALIVCTPIGFIYAGVYLAVMAIAIWRHKRGVITAVIIASLFLSQTPVTSQAKPPAKPKVVECNAFVIGGAVIVIGIICIWKLRNFCKAHFPTPPPPPPPTPPDTNNVPTNTIPPNVTGNVPALNLSYTPTSCDISTNGWMDRTVPANPVPFQDFITLSFSSSTNLTDWTNAFTVNCWLSSNSMETVLYDAAGVARATNWMAGNPYTQPLTNSLPFPINRSQPQLYFRDY